MKIKDSQFKHALMIEYLDFQPITCLPHSDPEIAHLVLHLVLIPL